MPQLDACAQSGADDRKMVKEIIIRTTQTAIMQTKYDTHLILSMIWLLVKFYFCQQSLPT